MKQNPRTKNKLNVIKRKITIYIYKHIFKNPENGD